jgi:hypothetical protein
MNHCHNLKYESMFNYGGTFLLRWSRCMLGRWTSRSFRNHAFAAFQLIREEMAVTTGRGRAFCP